MKITKKIKVNNSDSFDFIVEQKQTLTKAQLAQKLEQLKRRKKMLEDEVADIVDQINQIESLVI